MTLRPAEANTGVIFRRTDLDMVDIPARIENVGESEHATILVKGDIKIYGVEHLLSAISGMSVDNIIIDISTSEIPIMDGSANLYVFLIQAAGIKERDAPKRFIRIKKIIRVEKNDSFAQLKPLNGFRVLLEIKSVHPIVNSSKASIDFSNTTYIREISRARTFFFSDEIESLRAKGFARGGTISNSIIIDGDSILNQDGLRCEDELVRHKILDIIGVLYLLGNSVLGEYESIISDHKLTNSLLSKLNSQQDAWEFVTFEGDDDQ